MLNLLTYNLNDLDKNKISNTKLKSAKSLIKEINSDLSIKKCLGNSCGGTIYLINNNKNTNQYNKKLICKQIPLTSSITKPYIEKYYKIMNKIYNNHGLRMFINPILEYKFKGDYLYLIYPYYSGYNLEQLKSKILKLDNENFKVIIKHLVKQILKGLSILHNKQIYHQNITPYNIIVNTSNKSKQIKVKFYDLSINNSKTRVIVQGISQNPVTDQLEHVDFLRVNDKTKVTIEVPVKFLNETLSPGIKRGGVLNVVRYTVEVICPVNKIPESFEFNLEGLEIGDSIHISHTKIDEGVEPTIKDRDFTVASILAPSALVSAETSEDKADDGEEEGKDKEAAEESKPEEENKK